MAFLMKSLLALSLISSAAGLPVVPNAVGNHGALGTIPNHGPVPEIHHPAARGLGKDTRARLRPADGRLGTLSEERPFADVYEEGAPWRALKGVFDVFGGCSGCYKPEPVDVCSTSCAPPTPSCVLPSPTCVPQSTQGCPTATITLPPCVPTTSLTSLPSSTPAPCIGICNNCAVNCGSCDQPCCSSCITQVATSSPTLTTIIVTTPTTAVTVPVTTVIVQNGADQIPVDVEVGFSVDCPNCGDVETTNNIQKREEGSKPEHKIGLVNKILSLPRAGCELAAKNVQARGKTLGSKEARDNLDACMDLEPAIKSVLSRTVASGLQRREDSTTTAPQHLARERLSKLFQFAFQNKDDAETAKAILADKDMSLALESPEVLTLVNLLILAVLEILEGLEGKSHTLVHRDNGSSKAVAEGVLLKNLTRYLTKFPNLARPEGDSPKKSLSSRDSDFGPLDAIHNLIDPLFGGEIKSDTDKSESGAALKDLHHSA